MALPRQKQIRRNIPPRPPRRPNTGGFRPNLNRPQQNRPNRPGGAWGPPRPPRTPKPGVPKPGVPKPGVPKPGVPKPPLPQSPDYQSNEGYQRQITDNQKAYDTTISSLADQEKQTGISYGLGQYGGDIASNPYSRAALLQRSYNQGQRATTNTLASRGQLYAGSATNAFNTNRASFSQASDSLQKDYNARIGQIESRRQAALNTLNAANEAAQRKAVNDASKIFPSTPENSPPSGGGAPATGGNGPGINKPPKNQAGGAGGGNRPPKNQAPQKRPPKNQAPQKRPPKNQAGGAWGGNQPKQPKQPQKGNAKQPNPNKKPPKKTGGKR